MNEPLAVFRLSADMARHAGQAQAQIARNIANADTPGYRAQSLESFTDTLGGMSGITQRTTRPTHMIREDVTGRARLVDSGSEPSPNGNTVSLEDELLGAAEVASDHRRALTVYGHAMTVLRTSIGR
ncbi:FlgB family protein [Salipiger sp. IMCC34102]|uniref:FlgB family protein n=1 Tax=Salipiger sp. IMCC34102 TaxID=2510647 RepID=UPI00101D1AB1|nr:FlgB family protein [Salipiger sp. IMCC34102]RYH01573.1 FlgB family protein [Salipiger sp. IMCC34102]